MKYTKLILLSLFVVFASCNKKAEPVEVPEEAEKSNAVSRFVTIGTGGVTGVYYHVGEILLKLINNETDQHGLNASFEATGGSVFNINAVLNGRLVLAVAQGDRQFQAYYGLAEWEKIGPQKKLRVICSLHDEAVTLVTDAEQNINTVHDLQGKTVNIGNMGSGQRSNSIDVLTSAGLNWKKDIKAENINAAEAPRMFQNGSIDAFFYTVGHPAGAITEAANGKRAVKLIPVTGMEELLNKLPYYQRTTINVGLYPKVANQVNIPTIGVVTTLVTSADVDEETIYMVTKILFENLETFKKGHKALSEINPHDMVSKGIFAPYHPGAEKYYREVGLLK